MSLHEVASATLSGAERRLEIAARNVANANTPGYKREVAYTEASGDPGHNTPLTVQSVVQAQGVLVESGEPLDLAINGDGVLLVRDGQRMFPSRGGKFQVGGEGALTDAQGRIVQQAGGGDLVIEQGEIAVRSDGTVLVDDIPYGSIGLYEGTATGSGDPQAGFSFAQASLLTESNSAELRQGMVERSNVTLSDEIVGLMQTQRMAESAAQIIRAYDQLVGQAVATFNRSGK